MKLLILAALLISQTTLASESLLEKIKTSNEPTCYGREYSEAHLKNHPEQTVQKVRAKLVHEKEYDSQWMTLEVTLKGEKNIHTNYKAAFVYTKESNTWAIECDGGNIKADLNKKGNLVINNNGFVLDGGCGSGEESEYLFLKNIAGGDDVFELVPLPQEYCQQTANLE